MPLTLALHTSAWREDWDAAFAAARDAGYSHIEAFCLPHGAVPGPDLRTALEEYGLALAAMEFGGDWVTPERAGVELDGARRMLKRLRDAGGTTLVASGGRLPPGGATPVDYAILAAAMETLGAECRAQGVALAFHPRQGTLVGFRDQIHLMMRSTDAVSVGLCLDTGEAALCGCDPWELLETYGARIRHVHLRDVDWFTHDVAPPGEGELDLDALLRRLQHHDYNGVVTVEPERIAQPEAAARAAREFVQAALEA